MKGFIKTFISAALLLVITCFVALPAQADTATEGYYTYRVSDGEATITSVNTEISGNVTIPNTLGGYTVTGIGDRAFASCSAITSVTIPNGVTSIGKFAFYSCFGLRSIIIPGSATSFRDWAFPTMGGIHFLYTGSEDMWDQIEKNEERMPDKTQIVFDYTSNTSYHVYDDRNDLYCNLCNGKRIVECVGASIYIEITAAENYPFKATGYNAEHVEVVYVGQTYDGVRFANEYCLNFNDIGSGELCFVQETTGAVVAFTVESVEHSWEFYNTVKPTCVETGFDRYRCQYCYAEEMRNITPVVAHTWNAGYITKKATCNEEGVKTYNCVVCSDAKTEQIAKLTTHTYDGICDTNCNDCGHIRTDAHKWGEQWRKDSNTHWHICLICACVLEKAEHIPGPAATETTDQVCTICGYILEKAIGKTYTPGDVNGELGITDADAVYLLYHIFLPDAYPIEQNCDFNNDAVVTDKDAIYLLYHVFLPDAYPLHQWNHATCDEPQKCEKCGAISGSPLGHSWADATCVDPKTCQVCGQTEGEAPGHQWRMEITKEPTATTKGERTYTCNHCGSTYVEPIDEVNITAEAYGNPRYIRTSPNPDNYMELTISGNKLSISGKVMISGLRGLLINCGEERQTIPAQPGKYFLAQMSLDQIVEPINLIVYTNCDGQSSYWSYFAIKIGPDGDGYSFIHSPALENNISLMTKWVDPNSCLKDSVSSTIQTLSEEIVGDETNTYKKMYLLQKWVAENVYYDYDYYEGRTQTLHYDAESVLKYKYTVCSGYANLLYELLQAQGIPSIIFSTYSTGSLSPMTQEDAQVQNANHAQVHAYLKEEGRWVIIDATWNSGNKYYYGKFIPGGSNVLFFDTSLDLFSYYHKTIRRNG